LLLKLIVEILIRLWLELVLVSHTVIGLTITIISLWLEPIKSGVWLFAGPLSLGLFGVFPSHLLIEEADQLLLLHDYVLD